MNINQSIISEVMKSTFLSIAFFTIFDVFIQGYSDYHNWIIPILVCMPAIYHLATRYNSKH